MNNVTAFINAHESSKVGTISQADYSMNKELLCAVIDRIGGKDVFLASYIKNVKESKHPSGINLNFKYDYPNEDNLKFWDAHRENIMAGFQRHADGLGYDSAVTMLSEIFEDKSHSDNSIEAALSAEPCDYASSTAARKEICTWLSLAAISDAYIDFHFSQP